VVLESPGKVLDFFPVKEWEPCINQVIEKAPVKRLAGKNISGQPGVTHNALTVTFNHACFCLEQIYIITAVLAVGHVPHLSDNSAFVYR